MVNSETLYNSRIMSELAKVSQPNEKWVQVYINRWRIYFVSDHGRVLSISQRLASGYKYYKSKSRILDPNKSGRYLRVDFKNKVESIHRLVAIAFIPNPDNKPCVNHIDGNTRNNHVKNLEWCTWSENTRHSFDVLNRTPTKGESNGCAVITEADVVSIRIKYATGNITQKQLAHEYNVSRSNIGLIVNKVNWRHVI